MQKAQAYLVRLTVTRGREANSNLGVQTKAPVAINCANLQKRLLGVEVCERPSNSPREKIQMNGWQSMVRKTPTVFRIASSVANGSSIVVDFFNQINLLYGSITEFCSPQSCPEMKATDE